MPNATMPWNAKVASIPFDTPVLARRKDVDNQIPFMAMRHECAPNCLEVLLDQVGYGWTIPLREVEGWVDPAAPAENPALEVQRLTEALRAAERRLHAAWQMLEAINENDPSRDRKAAAERAWAGLGEVYKALQHCHA